jgi:hypothetical protein
MSREQNTPSDNMLFQPGIVRNKNPGAPIRSLTMNDVENTALSLTGSFRYDSPGAPLKSTQQLMVDWSEFANHTFFNSAEAKVQKAFDKIINRLPFDGTKTEFHAFVDGLTGFEKYVLDQFPKHTGYLAFSGSSSPTNPGTYTSVLDFKGTQSPLLSKNPTGQSVMDLSTSPFTFEFYVYVPSGSVNDNQIIVQKLSGSNGISMVLSSSAEKTSTSGTVDFIAMIRSGSLTMSASMELNKGRFSHCASVFDRTAGPGQIKLYRDGEKITSSSMGALGQIDFKTSPLIIGSGSAHDLGHFNFEPVETLSGAMDEFRIWHSTRTQREIQKYRFLDTFAQKDLRLLYRFNEPSGSFAGGGSSLVLDHSGNGLHSAVQNFTMALRDTGTYGTPPVSGESSLLSAVLFPSFGPVTALNTLLLSSASSYDYSNPNLVTRLVPPHYLQEASYGEGFQSEKGDIGDEITVRYDQPGGARVGQPQIIAGLLFTFAETFDELKMFIDEFKRLLKVDVLSQDVVSDQLLPWLSRYYGISLPSFFANATAGQFLDGTDIKSNRLNTTSLQTVQNTLWRRIFSDLPFILSTRGTHASLRAILANMGINADGPVRIREFGGSKQRNLGDSFVRRHEIAAMLDMSGSLNTPGTLSAQGIDDNKPFLSGSFLSGSRIEPGVPLMAGTLVVSESNDTSDGLFTSGSWTVEGTYRFDNRSLHFSTQSLARLHVTGTDASASEQGVLFNVLAFKPSVAQSATGSISLYGRPSSGSTAPTLHLQLTGVDVFDGQKWQISFGRDRNDRISSFVSSSYFLRAGKFTPAGLEEFLTTASYFDEGSNNALQTVATYNTSGAFVVVGSQSLDVSTNNFLNSPGVPIFSKATGFSGRLAGVRFWSKGLTVPEAKTHAQNFKSLGVVDPLVNFNFVTAATGSFERLRQDVSLDQIVTQSDSSGNITLFDFSQNGLTFGGSGFVASSQVIKPERFDFDVLSADFQSGENPNKIRIRSFLNDETAEKNDASPAPLYEINQSEQPQDDKRVAIEMSLVQALNEDIMCIFSTLDSLDNLIGSPELVFAQEYTDLRNLRQVYFNRLTEKVNFQSFFEFFKWFDETIGTLLEQMLPSDSKFLGTSYVIESHALERPKFTYKYYDMYLGEENRGGKEVIRLQQFVGTLRKR